MILARESNRCRGVPGPQADADIHLGADGAFAHGLLAWPLGRGNEIYRDGAAAEFR